MRFRLTHHLNLISSIICMCIFQIKAFNTKTINNYKSVFTDKLNGGNYKLKFIY